MKKKTISNTIIYLILILVSITMLVPFLWMILTAFKTVAETTQVDPFVIIPGVWQTQNFANVIKALDFVRLYANTLGMVALRILFAVLTATLSGYAFARLQFKGKNVMFALVLLQMMIPVQIFIIPQYVMVSKLHRTNTIFGLVFPGIVTAFGTFLLRQAYMQLPKDLEEAARLDGLGSLGIFCRIMLPIAGPVISATAILAFLAAWNTYLEPLVFTSSLNNFTLPLSLNNFNDVYGQPQWNLQMAATTISILPIMLVYLIFQEKVTDAMVNSGLKG